MTQYKICNCFADIDGCLQEFDYNGSSIEVLHTGQSARFIADNQDSILPYVEIAEVAEAMIYTKIVDINDVIRENTSEQDESKNELSKEISSLKLDLDKYYEYLTDIEKRTIQDILTAAAERGGGRL